MEPAAVRDSSQMEIGISYRNAIICDGAKDKGKTAIDDCKLPEYEEYVEYQGYIGKVLIEAKPFESESTVVQMHYEYCDFRNKEVESNSITFEMVKEFCEERARIWDIYADYQNSEEVTTPLNEFNSKFFELYRSHAIQLITAAFELEILSLIFLMMEEVVNLFTKKTEDEVYNFFSVNLKEYSEDKFNSMKHHLLIYRDLLVRGGTPNKDRWDSNLLKRKFHSLQSYKERRQWLTAHFLVKRRNANLCFAKDTKGEMRVFFGDTRQRGYCCFNSNSRCDCDRDSDSDSDSDRDNEVLKLHLNCWDGVLIDAEPFKYESKVVHMQKMYSDVGDKKVYCNSKTIEMVKVFCEGRAKILEDDYADLKSSQNKLNEFNSKFLQDYRSYAIKLTTAAFELEIISLMYLMMHEVVNLFTKRTEYEVYDFFYVNLEEYREDQFNTMKKHLWNYRHLFAPNNDWWDPNLLKQKFHSLQSYKEQRQWLTAHFIFKSARLVNFFRLSYNKSAYHEDEDC